MSSPLEITSTKNPRIKNLLELQTKSRTRRKEGIFVIEGLLEVERAVKAGYKIKELYYEESLISSENVIKLAPGAQPFHLSKDVFEKISYRNTGGIVAVAISKNHLLENIALSRQPLLMVAEAVEKPGNIGALLRTADAVKADALIICDPLTDLYNPNVIRSSIGGVFTVPTAIAESAEVVDWLKNNKINIYCTALTASLRYDKIDYTGPSAIVMGTEATGLSDVWLKNSTQNIIIPMQGLMDSLNVSVSAAVVLFEAVRQRGL